MRVSSKGQVTIPRDLRELAGIAPNGEVVFGIEDGKITITPKSEAAQQVDRARLAGFLALLDRLEGSGDQTLDADDVMRMSRDRT